LDVPDKGEAVFVAGFGGILINGGFGVMNGGVLRCRMGVKIAILLLSLVKYVHQNACP